MKSATANGVRFLAALLWILWFPLGAQDLGDARVRRVTVRSNLEKSAPGDQLEKYRRLIPIRRGDRYDMGKVRQGIRILHRLGDFSDIQVRARMAGEGRIDLVFQCRFRLLIKEIRFDILSAYPVKKALLGEAIYLRENTMLQERDIRRSIREIREFLGSRGFFNPEISAFLERKLNRPHTGVVFRIKTGARCRMESQEIQAELPANREKLKDLLQNRYYIPYQRKEKMDRFIEELKDRNYFYASVRTGRRFLDPEKSRVHLKVELDRKHLYRFRFRDLRDYSKMILPLWKKEVSETWALRESRTRIVNDLKSKGFLQAAVKAEVRQAEGVKEVVFTGRTGNRYRLDRIFFEGNEAVSDSQLFELIKTDNISSNRLLWINPRDLEVDRDILKVYYYIRLGYRMVNIRIEPRFHGRKVDITFRIRENRRFVTDAIDFTGNRAVDDATLQRVSGLRIGDVFLRKKVDDATQRIMDHYRSRGYDAMELEAVISGRFEKTLSFQIREGPFHRTGDLIVLGASAAQEKLIRQRLTLEQGEGLNYSRILEVKEELERSTIFNRVQIVKVPRDNDTMDIAVKVLADDSVFYGIGLGVEKKQVWGVRTTLEYSSNNFLRTHHAFSSMLQVGPKETRGILAFDSPYFFGKQVNSRFRIWMENEIYPSFKFRRLGLGETLTRNVGSSSYYQGTISLYRTELTRLSIPESSIDRLNDPCSTADLALSYVKEARDNPLDPASGHFFLAECRTGLLNIFSSPGPYIRLIWNYQKNLPFTKNGLFSFSLRNGFASNKVPITERFFGGGIYTHRGFHSNKLGPLTEDGEPVGGNAFLFVNCDFTFPLVFIPVDDLYYSFFFDLGNVFSRTGDFDLGKLEKAVGFELKYKTPFGPLRLTLGYNLRDTGKSRVIFFIGIGNVL